MPFPPPVTMATLFSSFIAASEAVRGSSRPSYVYSTLLINNRVDFPEALHRVALAAVVVAMQLERQRALLARCGSRPVFSIDNQQDELLDILRSNQRARAAPVLREPAAGLCVRQDAATFAVSVIGN